jgi:hypothetical protein
MKERIAPTVFLLANLNHWNFYICHPSWWRSSLSNGPIWAGAFPNFHPGSEKDPVSETLCSSRTINDRQVQKLSNPECKIPYSESFKKDLLYHTEVTFCLGAQSLYDLRTE